MIRNKTKIPWITHPDYDIPLPSGHRFTSTKFSDLFNEMKNSSEHDAAEIFQPNKANVKQVSIAHDPDYIQRVKLGTLTDHELRRLGLSWSPELANRSFLALNGTLLTARLALKKGIACHLAGGTHHAHYGFGSGFCVFNDLAYTSLTLLKNKELEKLLILDCDVHQGDGTARILSSEKNVFTCSLHSEKNFPARKAESDLDIGLDDEIEWDAYREQLIFALRKSLELFLPDLVLYVAGVDVHTNDKLGRLNIDDDGLMQRELLILDFFKKEEIPIATVIGGGYSNDKIELARRHSNVLKAAYNIWIANI